MTARRSDNTEETKFILYALLGQVVIRWSTLEQTLNEIFSSFQQRPSKALNGRSFVLEKKLRTFRRACGGSPRLAKHRPWIDQLSRDLQDLGAIRHTLIHGSCDGLVDGLTPCLYFRRLRFDRDGPGTHEIKATERFLIDLSERIQKLDSELAKLSRIIVNPDDHSGENKSK
jgi:hypothetical protein